MTDTFLCCDLATGGACVAQSSACASSVIGVALSDLTASEVPGVTLFPADVNSSFPPGVDGHSWWTNTTPHIGFCLVAPNSADATHASPTEPIGCIDLSLAPGLGASVAQYTVPVDSQWDGYEFCYGAQLSVKDPQAYGPDGTALPCANINDLLDPGVAPTPVSGSCCAPANLFHEEDELVAGTWSIGIGQQIPGVPPNELFLTVDGGYHAYPDWDAGDMAVPVPKTCLDVYNEPGNCGQPPISGTSAFPVDSGLGATSDTTTGSSSTQSGGCSCATTGASGTSSALAIGLALCGVLAVAQRRRTREHRATLRRARHGSRVPRTYSGRASVLDDAFDA